MELNSREDEVDRRKRLLILKIDTAVLNVHVPKNRAAQYTSKNYSWGTQKQLIELDRKSAAV